MIANVKFQSKNLKLVLLVLTPLIAFVIYKYWFTKSEILEIPKVQVIDSELRTIHQEYSIGTSSYFLDNAAHREFGYATCTEFVKILQDRLAVSGLASRKVGLISDKGGAHDLLEVNVNGKWIVVDAMSNVIYQDSFLDLLMDPSLVNRAIIPADFNQELKKLVQPDFFSGARAVNLGVQYFSDPYRWDPKVSVTNTNSPQARANWCDTKSCTWEIGPLQPFTYGGKRANFSIVKVQVNGRNTNVETDQGFRFVRANGANQLGEFIPKLYRLDKSKVIIHTTADGPHRITVFEARPPIKNIAEAILYVPKPSILVFTKSPIRFYGANLEYNDRVLWSKAADIKAKQKFHSAFFMALPPAESAWKGPLFDDKNRPYCESVLGLPSNQPRIRIQPLFADIKNNVPTLSVTYSSDGTSELQLYSQKSKELYDLVTLPACPDEPCIKEVQLEESVTLDLFNIDND